jgi:hypothetical protein
MVLPISVADSEAVVDMLALASLILRLAFRTDAKPVIVAAPCLVVESVAVMVADEVRDADPATMPVT